MIISGDRVSSATCYLPLSDNLSLSKELGTRHRAAVGISEVTDSLTVIVSEETGAISVAYGGSIERGLNAEGIRERLRRIIPAVRIHLCRLGYRFLQQGFHLRVAVE